VQSHVGRTKVNRYGSYRALLGNSQAALISTIEIYNKPTLEYRDEATVILLVNAWELLFKSVLSRNRISIYRPKERDKPYQTLSLWEAQRMSARFFPPTVPPIAVEKSLEVLTEYRNNAVHFYNSAGFGVVVNALAQTSILNYREALIHLFEIDVAARTNLVLHPIGFGHNLDPVAFLKRSPSDPKTSRAVSEVVASISNVLVVLEAAGVDTEYFFSWYRVRLESVKKIGSADLVAGVSSESDDSGLLLVERPFNLNDPNWGRESDIVAAIGEFHGRRFTNYMFRALVHKLRIREQPRYYWSAKEGSLTKYSNDVIAMFRRFDKTAFESALAEYREHLAAQRKKNGGG
jgi:hypothetical protein